MSWSLWLSLGQQETPQIGSAGRWPDRKAISQQMRQTSLEVTSPLANEVSLNLLLVVMGCKPFAVIRMPREASWHVLQTSLGVTLWAWGEEKAQRHQSRILGNPSSPWRWAVFDGLTFGLCQLSLPLSTFPYRDTSDERAGRCQR